VLREAFAATYRIPSRPSEARFQHPSARLVAGAVSGAGAGASRGAPARYPRIFSISLHPAVMFEAHVSGRRIIPTAVGPHAICAVYRLMIEQQLIKGPPPFPDYNLCLYTPRFSRNRRAELVLHGWRPRLRPGPLSDRPCPLVRRADTGLRRRTAYDAISALLETFWVPRSCSTLHEYWRRPSMCCIAWCHTPPAYVGADAQASVEHPDGRASAWVRYPFPENSSALCQLEQRLTPSAGRSD